MSLTQAERRLQRRAHDEAWTITAQDGADDDGGTLYVLRRADGTAVSSAAWTAPLELFAHLLGHPTRRVRYVDDSLVGDPDRREGGRR